MGDQSRPEKAQELFDEFVSASTCRAALLSFRQLCEHLDLDPDPDPDPDADGPGAERPLYRRIKRRLTYWKADALWSKLDRRASRQDYLQNRACRDATVRRAFAQTLSGDFAEQHRIRAARARPLVRVAGWVAVGRGAAGQPAASLWRRAAPRRTSPSGNRGWPGFGYFSPSKLARARRP